MEKLPTDTWLPLNEAAQRLGVHATTLRRWADDGQVPFMVTPGGHRRFSIHALDEFVRTRNRTAPQPPAAQVWVERALAKTRAEIVVHRDADWMAGFNSEDRESHRQLGRTLMGALLQYIARDDDADDLLLEAAKLGRAYAAAMQQRRMSLTEGLRAVFFFRDTLVETAVDVPQPTQQSSENSLRLVRRITRFVNAVQVGLAEAYEQPGPHYGA
ncbi:MAG: helix-turn-helix domain-containing protein [Anaerolineae bacterium]